MDSNAKNRLWNSPTTDAKGVELECLIHSENLSIINSNTSDLDFTPGGTSFLDVTLAGDKVVVSHWFFPSIPSLSDHPYIYFKISRACHASRFKQSTPIPRVPSISRINLVKFSAQLSAGLKSIPLPLSPSKRDIDLLITDVSSLISVSARNSKSDNSPLPHRRCMPWWSKELCALRNNTRRAFKCWSVQKSLANRILYTEQKASYQRELRRAKRRSWEQFVNSEPDSKKMFSALRTLSGKSATIQFHLN